MTTCAQSPLIVERYLMNELNETEKMIFEEHFATCNICAESVCKGRLFIKGLKEVLSKKCENDGNPVEFLLVNGEEEHRICSVCLKDSIFELITSNEEITFRHETWKHIMAQRGVKAIISCVTPSPL